MPSKTMEYLSHTLNWLAHYEMGFVVDSGEEGRRWERSTQKASNAEGPLFTTYLRVNILNMFLSS
jgi:hypothetical protein